VKKLLGSVAIAPLVLAIGTVAAAAQDRPEGIRAGAFYLMPSIEGSVRYDDNIFLETGGLADSDIIMNVSPNLIIRSARRVHLLELDTGVSADFHADNGSDDTLDAHARLRGRYDISKRSSVRAGVSVERAHDNRGDDNTALQEEPTRRNVYRGEVGARTKPNRMSFSINGDVQVEDYEDADNNNNDDDRDVTIYGVGGRVGYEARKAYTVFIEGRYDIRDFNDAVDDGGIQRGSDGYRVRVGLAYRPTPKTSAEFGVGYLSRSFDEPTFGDVDGLDAKIGVKWELPNRNSTLGVKLSRTVAEATDIDVAGRLTTTFDVTLTHKFRSKWTAEGKLGYTNAEEDGGAGNKDDDTYRAGISADYNFTRRVRAGAFYRYERKVSNEVDQGHLNNVVGVRLRIGY